MTQPTQQTPDGQPVPRSLTSCPKGNRPTLRQIIDQLKRDAAAAVPFSQIEDGSYFTFLSPGTPGGVWRKTMLTRYNAVNEQTEAHCTVRPFDLVVPVTRYTEAAPTGRPFLTISQRTLPGVPR